MTAPYPIGPQPSSSPVTSVFGRTGAVVAESGDYTAAEVGALALGQVMTLVETTGTAGYALVNGTGAILSWTAPADGNPHRVMVLGEMWVTTLEVGGLIQAQFELPDGSSSANGSLFQAALAAGFHGPANTLFMIEPGSTFTVEQASALTSGASKVYLDLWAL